MNIITWSGDLAFSVVAEAREHFLKQGRSGEPNALQLKDMGKLDIAGLQVLLSLELWLEGSGASLGIIAGPECDRVNALAGRIGLKPFTIKDAAHA